MLYLVLLVFVPILIIFLNHSLFRSTRLPPGPNALQVLVNLWQLLTEPHIALNKFAKSYGPLMSFRVGGHLVVVASSPDTVKEFIRIQDRIFSGRHLPSVYHNIPGTKDSSIALSVECTKSWKLLRSMGQSSIFSSSAMELSIPIRKAKVMEMVNYIRKKEGEVVNLDDVMFATLTNIISSITTSRNLFDLENEKSNDFKVKVANVHEVMEKTMTFDVVDFLPILRGIGFLSKGKAKDLYRKIEVTWGDIIQERRSWRDDNPNSIQNYLDMMDELGFSDDQTRNALMEMLIAATDSSNVITVWMIVELIRNQELLCRVLEEIAQTVEKDGLSESLLSHCQYFQACIQETLRLHVPAPFLVPHRAIETSKVNTYVIPKDSMVVVNAWAIAQDPKYWEDAKSFKPERFLDSEISFRGTHLEYLPFGTGLRMCPGQNVAFKNIQVIVASLLHYFDWSLPNGVDLVNIDMNEKYVKTLKKEKPLTLVPRSRNVE